MNQQYTVEQFIHQLESVPADQRKRHFRNLCLSVHPDRNPNLPQSAQQNLYKAFEQVENPSLRLQEAHADPSFDPNGGSDESHSFSDSDAPQIARGKTFGDKLRRDYQRNLGEFSDPIRRAAAVPKRDVHLAMNTKVDALLKFASLMVSDTEELSPAESALKCVAGCGMTFASEELRDRHVVERHEFYKCHLIGTNATMSPSDLSRLLMSAYGGVPDSDFTEVSKQIKSFTQLGQLLGPCEPQANPTKVKLPQSVNQELLRTSMRLVGDAAATRKIESIAERDRRLTEFRSEAFSTSAASARSSDKTSVEQIGGGLQFHKLGCVLVSKASPPFEKASACKRCSASFGWFGRRHNCRYCGCTVCESCTEFRYIPWLGFSKCMRVCSSCSSDISEQLLERYCAYPAVEVDTIMHAFLCFADKLPPQVTHRILDRSSVTVLIGAALANQPLAVEKLKTSQEWISGCPASALEKLLSCGSLVATTKIAAQAAMEKDTLKTYVAVSHLSDTDAGSIINIVPPEVGIAILSSRSNLRRQCGSVSSTTPFRVTCLALLADPATTLEPWAKLWATHVEGQISRGADSLARTWLELVPSTFISLDSALKFNLADLTIIILNSPSALDNTAEWARASLHFNQSDEQPSDGKKGMGFFAELVKRSPGKANLAEFSWTQKPSVDFVLLAAVMKSSASSGTIPLSCIARAALSINYNKLAALALSTEMSTKKCSRATAWKNFIDQVPELFLQATISMLVDAPQNGELLLQLAQSLGIMSQHADAFEVVKRILNDASLAQHHGAAHLLAATCIDHMNQLTVKDSLSKSALLEAKKSLGPQFPPSAAEWLQSIDGSSIPHAAFLAKLREHLRLGQRPEAGLMAAHAYVEQIEEKRRSTVELVRKGGMEALATALDKDFQMVAESYCERNYDEVQAFYKTVMSSGAYARKTMMNFIEDLNALKRNLHQDVRERNFGCKKVVFSVHEELPARTKYQDRLPLTGEFFAPARCERSIMKLQAEKLNQQQSSQAAKFEALMESGYAYADLLSASVDSTAVTACVVHAARSFAAAMEHAKDDPKRQFAAMKLALTCLFQVLTMSEHAHPGNRLHFAQLGASVLLTMLDCSGQHFWAQHEVPLLPIFLERIALLIPIWPAVFSRRFHACDYVYLMHRSRELIPLLIGRAGDSATSAVAATVKPCDAAYLLLEGTFHGWVQDYPLDTARSDSIIELLRVNKFSCKNVEDNSQSFEVSRTPQGFIDPSAKARTKLANGNEYVAIHGFSFNLETGEIILKLQVARPGEVALFGKADVHDILSNGIASAVFTLDAPKAEPQGLAQYQPDEPWCAHPFQMVGFWPSQLKGTRILSSLLHADYLLKFFTTGVEVSGMAPFTQQSTESLLSSVAPQVRQVLSPLRSRRGANRAHRFWIAAGDIEKQQTVQNGILNVDFGNVPMTLETQLMKRNARGERVDDSDGESDSDEDHEPNAEKEFAKSFTANYSAIARDFPIFNRIRELHKICGVYTLIGPQVQHWSKVAAEGVRSTELKAERESISATVLSMLRDIRAQIVWPIETDQNVEKHVSEHLAKCRKENNLSYSYQFPANDVAEVRRTIRNQLSTAEASAVQQIVTLLQTNVVGARVSSHDVKAWLNNGTTSSIQSELADACIRNRLQKYSAALQRVTNSGISVQSQAPSGLVYDSPVKGSKCPWVPAAFNKVDKYIVYGGVALCVSFRDVRINPPPSSPLHLGTTRLDAQRATGAPHSDAARLDNQRVNNAQFFQRAREMNAQHFAVQQQHQRSCRNTQGIQNVLFAAMIDPKQPAHVRGWLQNEQRHVEQDANNRRIAEMREQGLNIRTRQLVRCPIGMERQHVRGFESRTGHDYHHTVLNDVSLHRLQHRVDHGGRAYDTNTGGAAYRAYHEQQARNVAERAQEAKGRKD